MELKYSLKRGYVFTLGDDFKEVAVWRKNVSVPTAFSYLRFMTPTVFRILANVTFNEYKKLSSYVKELEREKKNLTLPDNTMELMFLAVLPEHQGGGRSSCLLNPVLEYMDKNDYHCFLLTNNKTNETIYKKKGFRTIRFYQDKCNGINNFFMLRKPKKI